MIAFLGIMAAVMFFFWCSAAFVNVAVQLLNQQLVSRPRIQLPSSHHATSQHHASVAALDTFVVGSYGHMDSSCSPSDFLSRSQAVLVGFCFGRRMYTANDSHITDFLFQEPGCDGTVAKTEVFEIDACVQVPPGSPDSGVYYKFSVERGESTKGRQYSGANCTGAQW